MSALMCTFDELSPYLSTKMEKTRLLRKKLDGIVFPSRQSWRFLNMHNIIIVLFPNFILTWRVNTYASRQGKCINWNNKSSNIWVSYHHLTDQLTVNFDTSFWFEELHFVLLWSLVENYAKILVFTAAEHFCFKRWQHWGLRKQLAAVARETYEEQSRSSQSRNTTLPRVNEG